MLTKKSLLITVLFIICGSGFATDNININNIYDDFDTAFRETFVDENKTTNNNTNTTKENNVSNNENKSNSTQKEINEIQTAINKLNLNDKNKS